MNKTYLFINGTDFTARRLTGAHKRFLELVRGIARHNRVILVSGEVPQLADIASIEHHPIRFPNLKLPHHLRALWAMCATLQGLKKTIRYDHAVSFNANHSVCYRLCGYGHVVSLFREDLIEYRKAAGGTGMKLRYFQWQERVAVRASEKIIVQCRHDRDSLLQRNARRVPGLAERVFIQINNVNPSWVEGRPLTARHDGDTPRILFAGNFSSPIKGHRQLLPAMARLSEAGFDFALDIVGAGRELARCQNEFAACPGFNFHGYVDTAGMNALLSQADIVIVPSLVDSCPNAVLEGLYAGAAVYGSNRGGIPDILQNPDFMFEPDAEHIYDFMKDKLTGKKYIADARAQEERRARLTFDWAARMEQIIEG